VKQVETDWKLSGHKAPQGRKNAWEWYEHENIEVPRKVGENFQES
jgi:hypothetical protein